MINEPLSFFAGETVSWIRTVAEYPANAGWVLTYAFRSPNAKFNVIASNQGADFVCAISAVDSAKIAAGKFAWICHASKAATGERYAVATGQLEVKADLSAVDVFDNRSHAKRTLDYIEATLEQRASNEILSYTVAGRTLQKTAIPDLLKMRDRYKTLVLQEEASERIRTGSGGGLPKILVRFK